MGFLSRNINVTRYQAVRAEDGAVGSNPFEYFKEKLSTLAFVGIDNSAIEESVGWVNLFDSNDTSFSNPGHLWIGEYACFSLRRDKRRIPAAVLKEQVKIKCDEYLAANPGVSRVPKQKREELRESVRTILLARTLPTPSTYDVIWNAHTGSIAFCNLSRAGIELFEEGFRKTFPDLRLKLVPPYAVAKERAEGLNLSAELKAFNQAGSEAMIDILRSNTWIGTDFLMWLLYTQGRDNNFLDSHGLTAYIDRRIILCGVSEAGIKKATFAGSQDRLEEIKTALLSGKAITEARIFIEKEENQWEFTLKGDRFDFASFKTPNVILERGENVDELSEQQAVFLERVALVQKGYEFFTNIFDQFLKERLSVGWPQKLADINEWLQEGE